MGLRYPGYRLVQWLSASLPSCASYRCAERVADLQWRASAEDRAAVQANLALALGTPVPGDSPLVREVFRNFGRYLVEFFSVHRRPPPTVDVEGSHYLEEAQRQRRGTIVLTAHLGNWELGAVLLHRMGFAVAAVALPHDDPSMDRLFNGQRRRCGIEVIPLGRGAAHQSLQHLREGRLLGMLGDREFMGNGLSVVLRGRRVTLPRGPAMLSLRSRSPIVPMFLVREGDWTFRLCVEPPLWPERYATGASSVNALTQAYIASLERYLQRFASQWLIFRPVG